MCRSVDHTTAVIETLRARGELPVNLPAQELSTSLNLLKEAVLTAFFAGQPPCLQEERVVDNLVHIWMNAICADLS
jgi:hypothetical protein